LPSKNDPANQPESQPPDLFSSVETRAMLEEFRELVRAGILRVTPENEVLPAGEQQGPEAARQPEPSPASREQEVALLDKQLLEWLERRREQKGQGQEPRRREPVKQPAQATEAVPSSIRQKVIERVAQKVIENWDRIDRSADPRQSLREQIVERIADELLRRLQRNLE
jgi:hypothetical protein